ncbi:MAG: glycosyltransferase family 4 protein [Chloroflexi bacterium]|nr:glycosyltransferase family 4 protein [Chloroflexota bacterium]
MKIGLDARLTYYTRGGIAFYIRQLAATLPGLDPANDYLIFHSRKASETLTLPAGANARRADCWTPAHHRLERLALGVELLPQGLSLLHSPDFIPPLGLFRSVITIHDLTFLRYPQFLTAQSRRYYNDQIHEAVKRADAILTDSNATRADVLELLGVAADKVVTVHLAPDPIFQPRPGEAVEPAPARLNLPQRYLLFVGTFEPRKNVPGLLTAYAQLPLDAPPLVLAGNKGWLFDDVVALIDKLQLKDRVYFRPDFAAADLPALYHGAIALVLPSHYEGFGLPVLEAFACGTPVVIANRASLPEIAGGAAALCNPDDPASIVGAIESILSDSAYRLSLIAKGHARVKDFSWEKCARETLAVYRKVINQ